MSHFIVRSNSVTIFGTPNGHARTQFEQAMQRGFLAVITRPSPLRLMASAGHTSAHVGLWQCMHTTGTVCTDVLRSTYSRWIIDCPLCVSHSEQACTHAWQPMHRCGSTKNSISAGMSVPRSVARGGHQHGGVLDSAEGVADARAEVDQLARPEPGRMAVGGEVDRPRQAVDGDVARG